MSERDRAFMRGQLASVGILLDEPRVLPSPPAATPPAAADFGIDRDFVREALIRAGAPESDLEWLVASAPSELDALAYRPPLPEAWCLACNNAQPADEHGCVRCRSIDLPNPPPEPPAPKSKKAP